MIGHKLPNKTKSATVAEPKLFHQLNNPYVINKVVSHAIFTLNLWFVSYGISLPPVYSDSYVIYF
jgi:hypothetical protein